MGVGGEGRKRLRRPPLSLFLLLHTDLPHQGLNKDQSVFSNSVCFHQITATHKPWSRYHILERTLLLDRRGAKTYLSTTWGHTNCLLMKLGGNFLYSAMPGNFADLFRKRNMNLKRILSVPKCRSDSSEGHWIQWGSGGKCWNRFLHFGTHLFPISWRYSPHCWPLLQLTFNFSMFFNLTEENGFLLFCTARMQWFWDCVPQKCVFM